MRKLYNEVKAINRGQPFVYELYSGDEKDDLANFIELEKNDSIILRYDSIQKEKYGDFTKFWIQEIFSIFKLEAPKFSSTLFQFGKGVGKLGLFAGGLVASGGISLGLSVIGATISTGEALMKNEEKEEQEKYIIHALRQFKNEKESIKNVETLILSSIKLLYLISQNRNICFVVDDPKILTLLDIQILNTYYNLFKDTQSKIRLASEMRGVYKNNEREIRSNLLTILNWVDDHPDQLTILTEELHTLRHFRWFLRRYRLVDDLHEKLLPQVVKEDAFVGRGDYLQTLEDDAKKVLSNQRMFFRKMEANSGIGKTSLANKFVQLLMTKYSNENFVVMHNAFSGERTGVAEGLTEIRKALDILRAKVDVDFKDEIIEKVKQISESKAFRKGAEWFNHFSKLHSFVTPALSLAKLSVQEFDNIIGAIGSISDARETLESSRSLEGVDVNTQQEVPTKTVEFIILELIEEFARLASLSKENKASIIWVIDDIQWMDEMSALFFHQLLQDECLIGYPIYLLFLNRPADSLSRVQNTEKNKNLMLLQKYINENPIDLKGFSLEDVQALISESIVGNEEQHRVAALTIWEWFQQDDKADVEPIYITECLNLTADYHQEDSLILQYNRFIDCWQWKMEDVNLLAKEISRKLEQWSTEHKTEKSLTEKYSPCICAIMEERISRLKDYFEPNGDYFVDLIEAGSFVGEPFLIDTIDQYILQSGKYYDIERQGLDEVENFFQLIKRYWNQISNSDLPAYLFSHALYREYLSHKHFSISGLEITTLHQNAFRALYETLEYEETNHIKEEFRRVLLVNAIYHGIHSGNFDGQYTCLEYMKELCIILWNESNYMACLDIASEALELSDRANGKQHDDSISWLNRMAKFFIQLGQYYNALEHCADSIERIFNDAEDFYPDPEIVVETTILAGQSCRNLGRYDEAVDAYNIGINFMELLEEDHPFRITLYHDLANAYKYGNKFDEAEELFKEVISKMEKRPQTYQNSYSLASAYHNFGHLYFVKGIPDKADYYYQKSLKKIKQDNHENSSLHIRVLNNAAVLDIELEKYEPALGLLETSKGITLNLFNEDHILYGDILLHFATIIYNHNEDYQQAKNMFLEAIKIYKMNYTESHPDVASAYRKLGIMFFKKGDNSVLKGMNWIKRATKIYEGLYSHNDINTILGYELILIQAYCHPFKVEQELVNRILKSSHIKVLPTLILVIMNVYTDNATLVKVENRIRLIIKNQDRKLVMKEVTNVFEQAGFNDEFIKRAENVMRRVF
jgi:tetratricopeptide (TPR) repeat protein